MAHDSGCLREGTRLLQQAHFANANLAGLFNYQPMATARCALPSACVCQELQQVVPLPAVTVRCRRDVADGQQFLCAPRSAREADTLHTEAHGNIFMACAAT
jgi:hypothetical protein